MSVGSATRKRMASSFWNALGKVAAADGKHRRVVVLAHEAPLVDEALRRVGELLAQGPGFHSGRVCIHVPQRGQLFFRQPQIAVSAVVERLWRCARRRLSGPRRRRRRRRRSSSSAPAGGRRARGIGAASASTGSESHTGSASSTSIARPHRGWRRRTGTSRAGEPPSVRPAVWRAPSTLRSVAFDTWDATASALSSSAEAMNSRRSPGM